MKRIICRHFTLFNQLWEWIFVKKEIQFSLYLESIFEPNSFPMTYYHHNFCDIYCRAKTYFSVKMYGVCASQSFLIICIHRDQLLPQLFAIFVGQGRHILRWEFTFYAWCVSLDIWSHLPNCPNFCRPWKHTFFPWPHFDCVFKDFLQIPVE